jgi:hypothetical protein
VYGQLIKVMIAMTSPRSPDRPIWRMAMIAITKATTAAGKKQSPAKLMNGDVMAKPFQPRRGRFQGAG